jgi:hypothetical protein
MTSDVENPGTDAPVRARVIYHLHKKKETYLTELVAELKAEGSGPSPSSVFNIAQELEKKEVISISGQPQKERGGRKSIRKINWNEEINVTIRTQAVSVKQEDVVYQVTWGRTSPGSVYPKQLVLYRNNSSPQ